MRILSNTLIVSKYKFDVSQLVNDTLTSDISIQRMVNATGFKNLSHFSDKTFEKLVNFSAPILINSCIGVSKDIKVLIVVSQTNFKKIPNGAAILQSVLNLSRDTLCIEVVEGCNGYVKALKLLNDLLKVNEIGAIFCGDFGSQMAHGSDVGTKALFGDGFAFTIAEKTDSFKCLIRNDGRRGNVISFDGHERSLYMDGFEVFQFALKEIPQLVLDYNDIDLGKNSIVAFHQASKIVVDKLAERIGIINLDYELFNATHFGNLGPASIPGFIAKFGPIQSGIKIYCIGFGSGLSWGICEVEWQGNRNEIHYV